MMDNKVKILNAVKVVGGTVLTLGIILFIIGLSVSTYSVLAPIGIGTIVGAVFIFVMGVFLVVTEEMITKGKDDDTKIPQI
ncbi:hypothetical protein [Bacillus litorisediminis]|uniref:hypothetical protein n=1 Tax=Bacillus litorisediminis TaxID=2922713 RepID=UPI0028BE1A31|nr:hypothetical protein [Bacillus litorisediminis]